MTFHVSRIAASRFRRTLALYFHFHAYVAYGGSFLLESPQEIFTPEKTSLRSTARS